MRPNEFPRVTAAAPRVYVPNAANPRPRHVILRTTNLHRFVPRCARTRSRSHVLTNYHRSPMNTILLISGSIAAAACAAAVALITPGDDAPPMPLAVPEHGGA